MVTNAVVFTFNSPGNYGSTVYDPMREDVFLKIYVCDNCLVKAGNEGRVEEVQTLYQPPQFKHETWRYKHEG